VRVKKREIEEDNINTYLIRSRGALYIKTPRIF